MKVQNDRTSAVLFGWLFFRGFGWLAPWSKQPGTAPFDALERWGAWLFTDPGRMVAVALIIVGGFGIWAWRRENWAALVGLCAAGASLAFYQSVGFYATQADPPATECLFMASMFAWEGARCGLRHGIKKREGNG